MMKPLHVELIEADPEASAGIPYPMSQSGRTALFCRKSAQLGFNAARNDKSAISIGQIVYGAYPLLGKKIRCRFGLYGSGDST